MLPERARRPTIESTTKPWFGPRRRARATLQSRQFVLPPQRACDELLDLTSGVPGHLQHLRFIDYVNRDDGFRYTIVLCNTSSSPQLRDALYDQAEEFVARTGWYPLTAGTRMESVSRSPDRPATLAPSLLASANVGSLTSVERILGPDDGCSIRLNTTKSAILLDAGFARPARSFDGAAVVLLSHVHRDHLEGLRSMPEQVPVVMSRQSARAGVSLGLLTTERAHHCVIEMHPGQRIKLGKEISLGAIAVPHFPGALGYVVEDDTTSLLFTGDICLKSARHDFTSELSAVVRTMKNDNRWVLLDGTMAGRGPAGDGTDPAELILEATETHSDIAIVAPDSTYLLYAYMDVFWKAKESERFRHTLNFLVTPRLRDLFRQTHESFILRDFAQQDPFMRGQYGDAMSAWAESRWLYWLDDLASVPTGKPRLWFLEKRDYDHFAPDGSAAHVRVGRAPAIADSWTTVQSLDIDTSPWTLHSSSTVLASALEDVAKEAKVVLFHNYADRLNRFIRQTASSATSLSSEPIPLRTT